jgi:hypothetical protein
MLPTSLRAPYRTRWVHQRGSDLGIVGQYPAHRRDPTRREQIALQGGGAAGRREVAALGRIDSPQRPLRRSARRLNPPTSPATWVLAVIQRDTCGVRGPRRASAPIPRELAANDCVGLAAAASRRSMAREASRDFWTSSLSLTPLLRSIQEGAPRALAPSLYLRIQVPLFVHLCKRGPHARSLSLYSSTPVRRAREASRDARRVPRTRTQSERRLLALVARAECEASRDARRRARSRAQCPAGCPAPCPVRRRSGAIVSWAPANPDTWRAHVPSALLGSEAAPSARASDRLGGGA